MVSDIKYDIICQRFLLYDSILIVNHRVVSSTVNVNPSLFYVCHFFNVFLFWVKGGWRGLYISNVAIYVNLPSGFLSKFHPSMTILHYKSMTREGRILALEWNPSIIHDNMCSLIHKKFHPQSYHSDIKFHTTLNTIFSGVRLRHL